MIKIHFLYTSERKNTGGKYMNQFRKDLANAKHAEKIVRETFSSLTDKYEFYDVSEDRAYYYKGDIKCLSVSNKNVTFIEVKDDSRIAETGNILCEVEVYYKECDYYGKGNMDADYDIYCIVSKQERKIYVLDFKELKRIHKWGTFREIDHPAQTTYCYLLPLGLAKSAMIEVIDY